MKEGTRAHPATIETGWEFRQRGQELVWQRGEKRFVELKDGQPVWAGIPEHVRTFTFGPLRLAGCSTRMVESHQSNDYALLSGDSTLVAFRTHGTGLDVSPGLVILPLELFEETYGDSSKFRVPYQ